MKTLKLITAALLLGITFYSCSSSDDAPLSCEKAMTATLNAEAAFNASTDANHESLCKAYKAALRAEINACGDETGELQAIIDDLGDCTLAPNMGVISVTVGSAPKTFENVTVTTVGTTRKVKGEDATTSDWIYFEIQQGATGANAISNFNIHLISSDYNPMPEDEGGNWTSNITTNSATNIDGTFYGYVTSPTTGADLDLVLGVINVDL